MNETVREIAEGIFWIGSNSEKNGIYSNTFLLKDGGESVLFDPSYVFFDQQLHRSLLELVALRDISYIVLQHLSPIICKALPMMVEMMPHVAFVVQERAVSYLRFYVGESILFELNDSVSMLRLQSGRILSFVDTPYLPSLETFLTYDSSSKVLFSSFLFSARPRKWTLFADRVFYKESMKAFHEQHIPSNEFLRPAMDLLLNISKKNGISMLASTNGSIINSDIEKYINILRDLYCGIAVNPIKNDLTRKEGYVNFCNQVIESYLEAFSQQEVKSIFIDSTIVFDEEKMKIIEYPGTGEELWENMFSLIYIVKGLRWLSIVFEQVNSFIKKYNVRKPSVFSHREEEIITLDKENVLLKERIFKLESKLEKTVDSLVKDEVTNLYNEAFLHNFLKTVCTNKQQENFVLLLVEIDELWKIKHKYGQQGETKSTRIVQILADILKIEAEEKGYQLFKMASEGAFLFYIPEDKTANVILLADSIKNEVVESARFQENITVSASIVSSDEFIDGEISMDLLLTVCTARLIRAKNRGINQLCFESDVKQMMKKTILIIESDEMYIEMIRSALENWSYNLRICNTLAEAEDCLQDVSPQLVISELELSSSNGASIDILSCKDGFTASKIIEKDRPDLIISELMIPKDDGLVVREHMLQQSASQNTPFILISHMKDEKTVDRAMDLKVDHYLKKPFMMNELIGIVRNILQ